MVVAAGADNQSGLIEQAPVAVVVTDRKGTVARWNRGAQQLFGWSAAEVLGRKIFGLAAPVGDAEQLADALADVAAGESWEGDIALAHRGGTELLVHLRASPLEDVGGARVGVMLVALEVRHDGRHGDVSDVGGRIARARREAGLTQTELAERVGLTRRSIQAYEAGAIVPYKHLGQLGEVLHRPPSWFLSGEAATRDVDETLRELLREVLREELARAFADLGLSPALERNGSR